MWKKITTITVTCMLCIFFSFRITNAAEISGTERNITDYKQIAALVSDTWEDDYFEKMIITPGSNAIEKDGEKEKFSQEFDVSASKAEKVTYSEYSLNQYLDKQEGVYQIEQNEEGDLEVTAPYQTKRIIVESDAVDDTYGASDVYVNQIDHETILQYGTEEEAESAYEKLKNGNASCYPDKVVAVDNTAMGLPLSQDGQNGEGSYSWGSDYMGMNQLKKEAVQKGYTRKVSVAVVDTGINASNRLFKGRTISADSYNFFGNNKNVKDTFGHGTHVSGIIADATPANVSLLVLRVSNNEGKSSLLTIKAALQYAVSKKAVVINLSMGFIDSDAYLYDYLNSTIDKAYDRGIPVCCAAGNGANGSKGVDLRYCYPACYSKTIAVSAIDSSQQLAYYSNRGKGIDFTAPGTGIVSANYKGNLIPMSGTSMAAPHISAAIAYLKILQPNLSVDGVYRELKMYSRDLGAKGRDSYYGWGCPILSGLFKKGIVNKKYIVILRPTLRSAFNERRGIRLKWKRSYGAASYYIYRRNGKGAWRKLAVASATQTTYLDKKAKQGKQYSYKIRPYNSGVFGRGSAIKTVYRLKSPGQIKVKRVSGKKVSVIWKKMSYSTNYQVQYAGNRKMKKARKISTSRKNTTVKTKKLQTKVYYFRVRYLYRKNGIKSWSAWSQIKKITVR